MSIFRTISNVFWSEHFWLLPNTTWTDMESDETTRLPAATDMFIPLLFGLGLFVLRLLFERIFARPVGRWFKLRESKPKKPRANPLLEATYRKRRKILPAHNELVELSKKTDMSTRQIERWWRLRKAVGKLSELQRFCETCWRFIFYFAIFVYGLFTLWDKPWFWDTKHCWYNYPRQHISDDMWWYYMVELGFYWSLIYSLFMDNKRKDFVENVIHHFATISLMVFSWVDNMVRVGTLVLVVHDAVDYWLEGAKLAKYMRFPKLCDALFVVFTLVWIATRLIMFPVRILHTTLNEGHHIEGMIPAYYVFNVLLCVLQALHIFWFSIIVRMFYQYIVKGEVEKDDRSDTDEVPEDDEDETEHPIANGMHKSLANGSLTYGVHTSLANGIHSPLANGKVTSNNNISPSKMVSDEGKLQDSNGNIPK